MYHKESGQEALFKYDANQNSLLGMMTKCVVARNSDGLQVLVQVVLIIVANRPVLAGTVPIFDLLSRPCPDGAV